MDPVDALTLVARRIARVEAQQSLEELDGAILNGVQIHGATVSPILDQGGWCRSLGRFSARAPDPARREIGSPPGPRRR